jgi:hypothetical protein
MARSVRRDRPVVNERHVVDEARFTDADRRKERREVEVGDGDVIDRQAALGLEDATRRGNRIAATSMRGRPGLDRSRQC